MQRDYNPYRWEYTVIARDGDTYRTYHHIWEVKKGLPLRFEYINNNRWSEDYYGNWRF